MKILLRNARLIDGATLLIEGEKLLHAVRLTRGDEPSDAEVVDLGDRTVIPGPVEGHIHLSYNNVKVIADLDLNCPPEYSTLVSAKNAEGDPLKDIAILQDRAKLSVMKGGIFVTRRFV